MVDANVSGEAFFTTYFQMMSNITHDFSSRVAYKNQALHWAPFGGKAKLLKVETIRGELTAGSLNDGLPAIFFYQNQCP